MGCFLRNTLKENIDAEKKNSIENIEKIEKKYKHLKIEYFSFFYINEKSLKFNISKNHPQSLSVIENNYIYRQMEYCVCKIIIAEKNFGTGFFCNIPIPNCDRYLPVLITNNHVLGEKEISPDKNATINISVNDELKKYQLYMADRLTYTSKKLDVTIIELKIEDNLNIYGYEIDDYNQPNKYFEQLPVYMVHYPLSMRVCKSIGSIRIIDKNYNIKHTCSTQEGSSGGPIINLNTFKLIGVHKGKSKNQDINLGTFIKGPIEEFFATNKNIIFSRNITHCFLKIIDFNIIKDNQNETKLNYDRFIKFMSTDHLISVSILCSGFSIFANIENILYKLYPEYKHLNCFFLCNGNKINRFKTINENKISEEGYVVICIYDDLFLD